MLQKKRKKVKRDDSPRITIITVYHNYLTNMKNPDNLQRPNTTRLPERCTNTEYSLSAWPRFLWDFCKSILPDVNVAQLDDITDLLIRNNGLNFRIQPKQNS